MLDPAAIGSLLVWKDAETRPPVDPKRNSTPRRHRHQRFSRSLAQALRAVADRLEPAAGNVGQHEAHG